MEKERVFGITGAEYTEQSTLIFPHLETVLEYLKDEIKRLGSEEERDFTISVKMMTNEEVEALPDAADYI